MSKNFDRSEPCSLFLLPPSAKQAPSKMPLYRFKTVDGAMRYFMLALQPNSRRFYRIVTESGAILEVVDIEATWKGLE